MRKILCLAMVCILASVFMPASNVLAIGKAKIENTEWLVGWIIEMYDATGLYQGAMVGGDGLMRIYGAHVILDIAPTVSSDFGVIAGARGSYTLTGYILRKDRLRATWCTVDIVDALDNPIDQYDGECQAKINFVSAKACKGKLEYTYGGVTRVVTFRGKKISKFTPTPQYLSLR
jgi:hypothetical protein